MKVFEALRRRCAGKKLFVLGHDRPDADTVLATELFCRFARRAGIVACAVRTGTPDAESARVISRCCVDTSAWTAAEETGAEDLLFLVDCHETPHNGFVTGCIDHHPTQTEKRWEIHVNGRASSAALTVLRIAREEELPVQRDDEIIAVRSVYADTQSLISPKFVPSDRPYLDEVIEKYALDRDELVRDGMCLTDLSRPTGELAAGGLKYHAFRDAGGRTHRVASSHIEAENVTEEIVDRCLAVLSRRREEEQLEEWVLIVVDPIAGRSRIYSITARGVEVSRFDRFISRSVDVLPALERKFTSLS